MFLRDHALLNTDSGLLSRFLKTGRPTARYCEYISSFCFCFFIIFSTIFGDKSRSLRLNYAVMLRGSIFRSVNLILFAGVGDLFPISRSVKNALRVCTLGRFYFLRERIVEFASFRGVGVYARVFSDKGVNSFLSIKIGL